MTGWETRYIRPDDGLAHELVAAALDAADSPADASAWEWIEHGSANLVVLAGPVAVRLSRTPEAAADAARAQRLIDALPDLPFAVPRSLGPAVAASGLVAQAQQRLTGEPHPPGSGDPEQLRALLDAIHSADLEVVRGDLAPARSFMGGAQWHEVMTGQAIPLLEPAVRASARRIADALAQLDPVPPALNHGDLAGSNVLWAGGRVMGVLDWDLTAADDPAEDTASLGNWHGWGTIAQAVPAEVLRRAAAFRDSFPLQLLCHAIVTGRSRDELERALTRANSRLRDA